MNFDDKVIKKLLSEIRIEQHISPSIDDNTLINYIKDGMYNINEESGFLINYEEDLKARSLIKNYVLYARYNRIAEFKEMYIDDYTKLQAKYYNYSSVQ